MLSSSSEQPRSGFLCTHCPPILFLAERPGLVYNLLSKWHMLREELRLWRRCYSREVCKQCIFCLWMLSESAFYCRSLFCLDMLYMQATCNSPLTYNTPHLQWAAVTLEPRHGENLTDRDGGQCPPWAEL